MLNNEFVASYATRKPEWGYESGPNSLGELTYYRTYSRIKQDGTKERWHETVARVVNGVYELQRRHAKQENRPWNEDKARRSAEVMYDKIFNFKFTPPGRGLWMMGTDYVMSRGGAALNNCGAVSTTDLADAAAWLMDMSMLGVGVGFDTKGAGAPVYQPTDEILYVVADSREGWVQSVRWQLESYLRPGMPKLKFDYSQVRPAGAPIKGFGGVAEGPEPLKLLHAQIEQAFCCADVVTTRMVVDVMNHIGCCVVAGNVRRSAEIALGEADDAEFLELKNYELNPDRASYGWASNNSLYAHEGMDYSEIAKRIAANGEPGLVYMDVAQRYGRVGELKEDPGTMVNPCAEQILEHKELCVSADTKIQTRTGIKTIGEVSGTEVEVWNGEGWSATVPFETGSNSLYRVTLSDGSYLDATPGHLWIAKTKTQANFREVRTDDLEIGMHLPDFSLDSPGGVKLASAYEYGWFAGDGYIDQSKTMALVQSPEYSVLDSLDGVVYKEQHPEGYANPFSRVRLNLDLAVATQLRSHSEGLPDVILSADADSVAQFMGGWIDADGSLISNPNTEHYVLYGDEQKLRDAQILLRRIGVNHSTLSKFAEKGAVTNYGTRNQELWRLLIPSYECEAVQTRLKRAVKIGSRYAVNNAHPDSVIDRARKQKVVSVELLTESAPTYCFDESLKHQGVFGNVLTKQCTLVEVMPAHHSSYEELEETLKYAYLYGKSVTLHQTHNAETNKVMAKNRRIGTSQTGIVQFLQQRGEATAAAWLDQGYDYVQRLDELYSEWLGVPRSVRTTTVKPSGTVSLLSGSTPGVHFPENDFYIRRIRVSASSDIWETYAAAGYVVEDDKYSKGTKVIELPVAGSGVKTTREATVDEKAWVATFMAKHWSDNAVSCTITFSEAEADQLERVLRENEGKWKTVSFLPMLPEGAYEQMPYEAITQSEYESKIQGLKQVDLYGDGLAEDAAGELYCETDHCEIDTFKLNAVS